MQKDDVMKFDTVLPEDFSGLFYFTNYTEEDFVGVWGGKGYRFPALSTSPMVIPEHSPIEIQNIRKKFAKDLAEREFFKTRKYESLRVREGEKDDMGILHPRAHGMEHAGTYSMSDLTSFIQKALDPLPISKATVTKMGKPTMEEIVKRNDDGDISTAPIKNEKDLEKLAKGEVLPKV